MSRLARNVSIILRTERLIAQHHLSVLRAQTGMLALAAIAGAIGLIALNAAAFFFLAERMSPAAAALILGLVNFGVATLLALLAARKNAASDIAAATELRDLAIEDVEAEIAVATEEAKAMARSVAAIAQNPLGAALPALLSAVLGAILKSRSDDD